jgi:N-acetylmuramoyl-L-alanine amidase
LLPEAFFMSTAFGMFSAVTSSQGNILSHPSPNFGPRPQAKGQGEALVTMLVLHYTGMRSADEALERMCNPRAQVSAHYMVNEDGTILQLVDEDQRAWHAGVSAWRDCADINSCSIGVEIVNPGHEFGYRPFPDLQMVAVIVLCQGILQRHPAIKNAGIVGHSDIAPARKEDPGELFDWHRLAQAGIGFFPSIDQTLPVPDVAQVPTLLTQIGYPLGGDRGLEKALIAFQRRYRPSNLSGLADAETCCLLAAVAQGIEA